MSDAIHTERPSQLPERRALRILAKSVYRELKASGYEHAAIVQFTNELLDLVTAELRSGDDSDAS